MHITGPPQKVKKSDIMKNRPNHRNKFMMEQHDVNDELLQVQKVGEPEDSSKANEENVEHDTEDVNEENVEHDSEDINKEKVEHDTEDIIDDYGQDGDRAEREQNPIVHDSDQNGTENNGEGNNEDIPDLDEANEDDLEDY